MNSKNKVELEQWLKFLRNNQHVHRNPISSQPNKYNGERTVLNEEAVGLNSDDLLQQLIQKRVGDSISGGHSRFDNSPMPSPKPSNIPNPLLAYLAHHSGKSQQVDSNRRSDQHDWGNTEYLLQDNNGFM